MKATLLSLIFLVLAVGGSPATAAEWIRLSTPQFELYSTNPEAQSRELIDLLASAHSFVSSLSFIQGRLPQGVNTEPLRIIALSSKKEYAPYRLNSTTFGYFRHSKRGNYIVLQDIQPEHRQAAVHEYVHFMLRQAGLVLPLWLNEGIADFYSSLQKEERQTRVGQTLPGRMQSLTKQLPIDLTTLFAVDSESPFYKDPQKIPLFYAESWALVHMLAMSPDYDRSFPEFITSVTQGLSSAAALTQVYNQSVVEIQSALAVYLPALSHFSGMERTDLLILPVPPANFWHEKIQSETLREEVLAVLQ